MQEKAIMGQTYQGMHLIKQQKKKEQHSEHQIPEDKQTNNNNNKKTGCLNSILGLCIVWSKFGQQVFTFSKRKEIHIKQIIIH